MMINTSRYCILKVDSSECPEKKKKVKFHHNVKTRQYQNAFPWPKDFKVANRCYKVHLWIPVCTSMASTYTHTLSHTNTHSYCHMKGVMNSAWCLETCAEISMTKLPNESVTISLTLILSPIINFLSQRRLWLYRALAGRISAFHLTIIPRIKRRPRCANVCAHVHWAHAHKQWLKLHSDTQWYKSCTQTCEKSTASHIDAKPALQQSKFTPLLITLPNLDIP